MKVGVLAVQGDFAEHIAVLKRLGVDTAEVRLPRDLEGVEALIMPGGESTTISYLMDLYDLKGPIKEMAGMGVPIWGTCAGMIMMARELTDKEPTPMGLMDILVTRNAFGRQIDSFEADLEIKNLGHEAFRAVFIRAPVIFDVGQGVDVLAHLPDGKPVAVQQRNLLATAFHPELSPDTRLHQYFLNLK
ncbi:MAG: pyridoxal 5'-phosphate synthase glutaminase subunit PdxT [Dehalococcoidia bacterium]|nr:pyridoxal 5'-phosphate synthase glutaminase subunit PdxT [Dehalococcoidia bacterium]